MNHVLAGPLLAVSDDKVGGGVAMFFTILLLVLASAALFYLMSRSLRRLRGHVAEGDFAKANARRLAAKAARQETAQADGGPNG